MSDFTTNKAGLTAALDGTNPELAKEIVAWMNAPATPTPETEKKTGPQPDGDETIIITRPH